MVWFIVCWLIAGASSWIGITIYTKMNSGLSWDGFFQYVKTQRKSYPAEILKLLLYVVAWPIETLIVLFNVGYMKYWTKKVIRNFPKLDKEES